MRVLYGPLLKLFGGGQKQQRVATVSPQDDAAAERRASDEADRKARAAAFARSGRRSTLLSGGAGFGTGDEQKPKTLLGGNA